MPADLIQSPGKAQPWAILGACGGKFGGSDLEMAVREGRRGPWKIKEKGVNNSTESGWGTSDMEGHCVRVGAGEWGPEGAEFTKQPGELPCQVEKRPAHRQASAGGGAGRGEPALLLPPPSPHTHTPMAGLFRSPHSGCYSCACGSWSDLADPTGSLHPGVRAVQGGERSGDPKGGGSTPGGG